jgi:ferrous iron transport protein A
MMQLSVNKKANGRNAPVAPQTLAHLKEGESGTLDRLDLPEDVARRLMELGFLPGHTVVPARSAPGGEPRVYRVDGSEVALRRETASRLILRPPSKRPRQALEP